MVKLTSSLIETWKRDYTSLVNVIIWSCVHDNSHQFFCSQGMPNPKSAAGIVSCFPIVTSFRQSDRRNIFENRYVTTFSKHQADSQKPGTWRIASQTDRTIKLFFRFNNWLTYVNRWNQIKLLLKFYSKSKHWLIN